MEESLEKNCQDKADKEKAKKQNAERRPKNMVHKYATRTYLLEEIPEMEKKIVIPVRRRVVKYNYVCTRKQGEKRGRKPKILQEAVPTETVVEPTETLLERKTENVG